LLLQATRTANRRGGTDTPVRPHTGPGSAAPSTVSLSGQLRTADVKRLARLARTSIVGPTATYYAGVTAPVISAGVAMFTKSALVLADFDPFWAWYSSAFLAAFTGIVWYLVFMRWSYRHTFGRGTELTESTDLILNDSGLIVIRGPIETRIQWSAIERVRNVGKGFAIFVEGADPLIVPGAWFETDHDRNAFATILSRNDNAPI